MTDYSFSVFKTSLGRHLSSSYHVPGAVINVGYITMNKIDTILAPMELGLC